MNQVRLSARIQPAHQFCVDRDERGHYLPRSQQRSIGLYLPIQIENENKSIKLSFLISVQESLAAIPKSVNPEESGIIVSAFAIKTLLGILPKQIEWQLHGDLRIHLSDSYTNLPKIEHGHIVEELQVMPLTLVQLERETASRRAVEAAFDKAKNYLFDRLQSPLVGDEVPIRNAARFMTSCDKAGYDLYSAYNDFDEIERMNEGITEMLARKKFSHSSYERLMERTMDAVYLAHCPDLWHTPPPTPEH